MPYFFLVIGLFHVTVHTVELMHRKLSIKQVYARRPLDCFVAALLATTALKIIPYRDAIYKLIE